MPLSLGTAIKTKSIYEPAVTEDGKRILITRYYPRGVKRERFDLWLRALSPTKELLASYRTGKKTWRDFERSFLSELGRSPESAAALRQVVELAEEGDLTLLCYERSGLPCHRTVVQRVLTNPTTIRHSRGRRRPG